MREIKFRAKDLVHNKWIYGGLAINSCDESMILPDNHWGLGGVVHKETIGQFTGLYDTNGKEIYEGDILRLLLTGSYYYLVVEWNSNLGTWCLRFKGAKNCGETPLGKMISDNIVEVVGNIYDNPQLME